MNTFRLSNITLKEFRKFLQCEGLNFVKIEGDHERWEKKGLLRPVVFSNGVNPVPELFIQNTFKNLGFTRKTFIVAFNKCMNKK